MKKALVFLPFVSLILTVVLSGCSGAVSKPKEKTLEELLVGSWESTEMDIDSDGNQELENSVLTFTLERFIYHVTEYTLDGQLKRTIYQSGGWSIDEDTITQNLIAEDGQPFDIQRDYDFSDDQNVLNIDDHWIPTGEEQGVQRFERRTESTDVIGTWTREDRADFLDERFNASCRRHWTYEITTSTFLESIDIVCDGVRRGEWRVGGNVRFDLANLYMYVHVTSFTQIDDGESTDQHYLGHELRTAYAPTADPKCSCVVNYSLRNGVRC